MRSFLFTLAICLVVLAKAQSVSTFFDALSHFEEKAEITFSYDAELRDLIQTDQKFSVVDLASFVDEVNSKLPIEINQVAEGYLSIVVVPSDFEMIVKDSLDYSMIGVDFGVQVIVNDAPITTKFKEGSWYFNYKPALDDQVSVFSQGYKKAKIEVSDLFESKAFEIYLSLPTRRLNTVVVEDYLTSGIDLLPSRQSVKIDVQDLPLLPGETDGDVFASLSALPGVTNPDGRAGNLLIRGSETDQSLILYDNIPIYHRGHYYGTISPYNPKVIDNVQVYRGGFHPKLGDRVGGAVVIESAETERKSNYGVGANSLFAMAFANQRINDKLDISIGFRNSYTRAFNSPKLEEISQSVFQATALVDTRGRLTRKVDVGFNDFNGKVTYRPNDRNRFSLSTIHTVSDVNFSPFSPPDVPVRSNDNRYVNTGANLNWETTFGGNWSSDLSLTASSYDFEFIINTLAPGAVQLVSENTISDLNVLQEFSRNTKTSELSFGLDYKRQQVSTDYVNQLRDSSIYRLNQQVDGNTIAPFIDLKYSGFDKWFIQLGMRGTYYSVTDQVNLSPRVLVNYDLTNRATLKGSFGIYHQFLSQVKNLQFASGGFDNELWVLADGNSGFVVNGTQSMVGGVWNANTWVFDIEAFHKTANNLSVYEGVVLQPQYQFYTMDLELYGMDLLVKRQVSESTTIWTGYSFMDSNLKIDTVNAENLKSQYVQPHVWYVGGAYQKNRWKLTLGWRAASGLYVRSLGNVFAESTFRPMRQPGGGPPQENPFRDLPERYPNVYSLDVSASYKIPKTDQRWWSATVGFSVINAFDTENLTDQVYRSREGLVSRNAIGFAPNLMVTFEW